MKSNKVLPFVSVITVNYNGRPFLKDCFNALFSLNYPESLMEVIMVDNGSTDGSLAYVEQTFPEVKIIKNNQNNYCAANNLGIRQARGRYLAILNNDTKVEANWLMELVKVLESERALGAVGSKILSMDGKIESTGHLAEPDFYWTDKDAPESHHSACCDKPEEAESLSGCAVLYRKTALEDVGFFDEDFQMYMEDVDMSLRMKRKKWKLGHVPGSLVYHVHHGTAQADLARFYTERNRLLLVAKHYPQRLAGALLGRSYFTAQRDTKAQAGLYAILTDVVVKLLKHHKIETVQGVLREVFEELKKIAGYENKILIDRIAGYLNTITSLESALGQKEDEIQTSNFEIEERNRFLKEKDSYIRSLNEEIEKQRALFSSETQKRDETLQVKDSYIRSLNEEIEKQRALFSSETQKRDEALQVKDSYIRSLNEEIEKQRALFSSETQKRDEALQVKDSYIRSLNEEIEKQRALFRSLNEEIEKQRALFSSETQKRDEALQVKDTYIDSLKQELRKKEFELKNIYDSTIFKFFVNPLWHWLGKIKRIKGSQKKALLPSGAAHTIGHKEDASSADKRTKAVAICTIISKNYLAYARVLAESFLEHNQGKIFVLLTDEVDGRFDPAQENFTLIGIESLKARIPDFAKFSFQYNITEFNTAVKPFFLEYLFEKYDLSKLIYLDPDILVTGNFDYLFKILERYSIVLIPHITQPYKDVRMPFELDILRSGVYNLGFLGLSKKDSTDRLLEWWKERLRRHCKIDLKQGLFVDQKWIDLIPAFFEDIFILRDPGYNIAYWNFHYRKAYAEGKRILIDGKPAHFLHFSGLNPEKPEAISKHQDRFRLEDLKSFEPIFKLYSDKLLARGYGETKNWPCVFNYFDNGAMIPDIARKIYAAVDSGGKERFGNPFQAVPRGSFFNWLNEAVDAKSPRLTRLMYEIYKERVDVQVVYPDVFGAHREGFSRWFLDQAGKEYAFDHFFMKRVFPFNLKQNHSVKIKMRDMVFYKIRNVLKISLKALCRNNPWMITHLKMEERRWNRKINGMKDLFSRKSTFPAPKHDSQKGINVWGYFTGELGVGEGARANVKCLQSAGVPFSLINIDNHSPSRKCDSSFLAFSDRNPHGINLFHVNADMFGKVYAEKNRSFFSGKYNIGFWTWELSDFPDQWADSFNYCHEIWVPSSFVLSSIAKKSPVPVLRIPHAVEVNHLKEVGRSFFGLSDDEFLFLFIFDFFSYFERKNPLAVIQAFKKTFSHREKTRLIIKCINSSYNPLALKAMQEACRESNITIIDRYFYKEEVNTLFSLCDSYVSLHRSEGFGLTLAEAMFLGKPVIATAYSGNMDFMNINNSLPVKYKAVEIGKDVGPYKKGSVWADPDICHAGELMRFVYRNPEEAQKIGEKASQFIKSHLNHRCIGAEIKSRMEHVYKNGNG